ncbi:MAG: restriction endonuclease subunit S [Chryseobacterium gambrini]|nr:restriction endonuclease subunit S [Chryseobacterium gambrini]
MKQTNKLVPELRFPEFMKDGEWEIKTVSEVAYYENGKAHEQDIVINGKYKVVNSKFISTDGEVVKYTNEALCLANKNDTLMLLSDVPNGRAIAKCFYVDKNNVYTVNQRICKLTPFEINGKILYYLLNRNPYFLAFDDGVKQTNLKNEDVLNCEIALPKKTKDHKEQQKIADCLSSLDELITAHNDKLEALKNHKRGLLQNLFPQEGQKVPNYRFPEFVNDGEWKKEKFSHYIKLFRGSSPRPIQEYLTNDATGINWIKIGDTKNAINSVISKVEEKITINGSKKSRKVKKGELILANSMSFGKTYEIAVDGCIYDGWFVLREYEEFFHKPFLLQLLNSSYMQTQYERLSAGGIVQNISSDIVYNTVIFCTSLQEQKKIAEILSAVDNLITAQTEKIEQLKMHKKGLMQGLFPKTD